MVGFRRIVAFLCVTFSIVVWGDSSGNVDVLVCPEGCGPLQVDKYMSMLAAEDGFVYTPVITQGYIDNLNQMGGNPALWKTTIFANNDDTLIFASKGGQYPFKRFIPKPITENFKMLYGFYWGVTGHFFITLNDKIKTISDLKGKRIGLGFTGQSDWGMNPTLDLEYGYGITSENTQLLYLGPKFLPDALLSGEVDAVVAALGSSVDFKRWLSSSLFGEIKKQKKIYYLGHHDSIRTGLNSKLQTSYLSVLIPKGTLPRQRSDITTFADRDFKACHEIFPEENAYKVVMSAAKYGPKMMLTAGVWQTWSPEIMVAGLTEENAHPGAIRAFKELGWWDLRNDFSPIKLPKH